MKAIEVAEMNPKKLIKTRRSIAKVLDKLPQRVDIESIIEAGCYAPNHKRTEPWRFVVFEGKGRIELANAMVRGVTELYPHLNADDKMQKASTLKSKPFRAPVIIAVWCAVGRAQKNPPQWEDIAAVSACIENMSLMAHALGYGSIWRTGDVVDMPAVQKLMHCQSDCFDVNKGDKLMGFLYIGFIDERYPVPQKEEPEIKSKVRFVSNAGFDVL